MNAIKIEMALGRPWQNGIEHTGVTPNHQMGI